MNSHIDDSFEHEITSPSLKLGTAILAAVIIVAGVAPLAVSILESIR